MKLDTLTCPSCIKRIEKNLSRMDGISDVEVKFNSSKVEVSYDEDTLDIKTISSTLEKLGYPVLDVR